VFHIIVWAVIGLAVAAAASVDGPARRVIRLVAIAAVGMGGAIAGGWMSWLLWEFPNDVSAASDVLNAPVLMSYCLAACGALAALTSALGVMTRKT
jgi:hypothetical protein